MVAESSTKINQISKMYATMKMILKLEQNGSFSQPHMEKVHVMVSVAILSEWLEMLVLGSQRKLITQTFFDWAVSQKVKDQFKKDWEFIYATENDYSEAEKLLQEIPIPGTKKYHSFIPKDERSIFASEFSDAHEN